MTTATMLLLALASPHVRDASVYSDSCEGKKTANGEVFTQQDMTAASNDFPLGTKVKVTHRDKSVIVRINDRMHRRFTGKRIDLARKPWRMLEAKPDGLHRNVTVEVIN